MTLKLGKQHRVLEYYQVCSYDDPGLTLTCFTAPFQVISGAGKNVKQRNFQKLVQSMASKLVDAVN